MSRSGSRERGSQLSDKSGSTSEEKRAARDARELEIITRRADKLNAYAADGPKYQAPVDFPTKSRE